MNYSAISFGVVVTGAGQSIIDNLLITPESGGAVTRQALLVPGAIAADGCDCGQLAQTITRVNPTKRFPVDSSTDNNVACGDYSMMATVLATIFRCVPGITQTPGGKAAYPTTPKLRAAALWQLGDEFAMRTALTCYLADLKRRYVITAYYVGGSDFVGPEGNCGGVAITYGFQLV